MEAAKRLHLKLNSIQIFKYLFITSYIFPKPVNPGFGDVPLATGASRFFLNVFIKCISNVVKKVVNIQNASRSIMDWITLILVSCSQNLVQNVCLKMCGVKSGSLSSCVLLYFLTSLLNADV